VEEGGGKMERGPVEITGHNRVQLLRQFAGTVWPDREWLDPGTGYIPGPRLVPMTLRRLHDCQNDRLFLWAVSLLWCLLLDRTCLILR